ncbi:MAG: Mrp/NBP35 family ATP-binding protein [Syntrophomonas sp.]
MSDNCPTKGLHKSSGCNNQERGQEISLAGTLNDVKNVIAVMSGKGGVGKSTVSSLLAITLKQKGYQVGILDADITGPSIPKSFGISGHPGVTPFGMQPPETTLGIKLMSINLLLSNEDDPVIWRGPLLAGGVKQFWDETDWRDLDYLIVDLPPGTGDVPLTVLQSLPVTGVVIVSSPQDLASMVVKKSIKMTQKIGTPVIGLVENMSSFICPHCGSSLDIFGVCKWDKITKDMGISFLGNLAWDPQLIKFVDGGKIEEYNTSIFLGITGNVLYKLNQQR